MAGVVALEAPGYTDTEYKIKPMGTSEANAERGRYKPRSHARLAASSNNTLVLNPQDFKLMLYRLRRVSRLPGHFLLHRL